MAKNTLAYFPKQGQLISTTVTSTITTIFTPGVDGAKISKIYISSILGTTPTSATVFINNGVSDKEIIYLSTAPVAGTDLLGLVPISGGFNIESGSVLKASTSAGDSIQVVVYAENY